MTRFPRVLLLPLLAIVACGCARREGSPVPPLPRQVLRDAAPRADAREADPLARSLSIDLRQSPVRDALSILTRAGGTRILLETGPGLTGTETVSFCGEGIPFAGVLDWICRQADARYLREGETVWIARGFPRAALAPARTAGHPLLAVTAPSGGARVESGEIEVRTVYDPARADPGGLPAAAGPSFDTEASVTEFVGILHAALDPLKEGCPEFRLTRVREGILATLPERGHARLAQILDAFARARSAEPRPLDEAAERRLAAHAAQAGPDLEKHVLAVAIDAPDIAGAARELARRTGVPIAHDARQALLQPPEAVSLACAGETLEKALDRLATAGPWRHRRVDPMGIWLATEPLDPGEPLSREHPWDRCVVGAWEIPEDWIAGKGAEGILAAVRAELAPWPTRGAGRFLAVHAPTRLLVGALEPEAAARLPAVLDRFRRGLWPGWKAE